MQNGRPIAAVGGAGGSRIIMGVLFALLNRVEYGQDLAHAVDGERLDAQAVADGDPILIEGTRLAAGVLDDLRRRGHVFEDEGEYGERPRVQAAGFAGPARPAQGRGVGLAHRPGIAGTAPARSLTLTSGR